MLSIFVSVVVENRRTASTQPGDMNCRAAARIGPSASGVPRSKAANASPVTSTNTAVGTDRPVRSDAAFFRTAALTLYVKSAFGEDVTCALVHSIATCPSSVAIRKSGGSGHLKAIFFRD